MKKEQVRQRALALGFDAAGFTDRLETENPGFYLQWLREGRHAGMTWMEKNCEVRLDPRKLKSGLASAIVLATSYFHVPQSPWLARYAHGADYHDWIMDRMKALAAIIKEEIDPAFEGICFVDTGPVFERDLAVKAGLGWIGRNTCLIHPELGSFVFLSVILCNLDFKGDVPIKRGCGDCRLCLGACPAGALKEYSLDARRCLSYQTVEKRGERDRSLWTAFREKLVGCDLCQEACPFNQGMRQTRNAEWLREFKKYGIAGLEECLQLTEQEWCAKFGGSALSRIRYSDFMRNVFLVAAARQRTDLLDLVKRWCAQNGPEVLKEAQYCLNTLTCGQENSL